jgi:hypothetical protein
MAHADRRNLLSERNLQQYRWDAETPDSAANLLNIEMTVSDLWSGAGPLPGLGPAAIEQRDGGDDRNHRQSGVEQQEDRKEDE